MADGYSRWGQDAAGKEPQVIETGVFYRRCPCCAAEIEVKLSPERDDIEIKGSQAEKEAPTRQIESQSVQGTFKSAVGVPLDCQTTDRKCAYCFRTAIRGGVLCREHAFCRSCETVFPDGKPFEIKEFPMCEACSR